MKYAVLRGFNTPSRRFAIGQIVTADDIDGPTGIESLAAVGLVAAEKPDVPSPQPLRMMRGTNTPLPPPVERDNDDAVE